MYLLKFKHVSVFRFPILSKGKIMSVIRRIPVVTIVKLTAVVIITLLIEHTIFLDLRFCVLSNREIVEIIKRRELTLEDMQESGLFLEQEHEILFEQNINNEEPFPNGPTPVYRWDGSRWHSERDFCRWTDLPHCEMLNTTAGDTPIFLHDPGNDSWPSANLGRNQSREPELVGLVLDEMSHDQYIGFLDIGSQTGMFTLNVAKTGRQVIAIDPLVGNLLRLCKSVQSGGLTKNVIIFFNIFSDNHEIMSCKDQWTCAAPDIGGPSNVSDSPCLEPTTFHSAMLDDILPFITFEKAFLKVNVQGFEDRIIRGGSKFFSQIDVQGILLKWDFYKNTRGIRFLKDMLNLNYVPFDPVTPDIELKREHFMNWPHDVLWRKRSHMQNVQLPSN